MIEQVIMEQILQH
jgi:hypothetical protein